MNDKKDFVERMLAHDAGINAGTLSRAVREAFGKGLNLMDVRKLQEAHAGGKFDRVWDELFSDEEDVERSKEGLKRQKKSRGERRRKLQIKGRRDIDRDKIVMRDFSSHLVIYRGSDGVVYSQEFESRKRAEALVDELLEDGYDPQHVAYFKRMNSEAAIAA
jgi:hypothetical protein